MMNHRFRPAASSDSDAMTDRDRFRRTSRASVGTASYITPAAQMAIASIVAKRGVSGATGGQVQGQQLQQITHTTTTTTTSIQRMETSDESGADNEEEEEEKGHHHTGSIHGTHRVAAQQQQQQQQKLHHRRLVRESDRQQTGSSAAAGPFSAAAASHSSSGAGSRSKRKKSGDFSAEAVDGFVAEIQQTELRAAAGMSDVGNARASIAAAAVTSSCATASAKPPTVLRRSGMPTLPLVSVPSMADTQMHTLFMTYGSLR